MKRPFGTTFQEAEKVFFAMLKIFGYVSMSLNRPRVVYQSFITVFIKVLSKFCQSFITYIKVLSNGEKSGWLNR